MVRAVRTDQAGAMTETPQAPPTPSPPQPPVADHPAGGWNTENLKDYRALRRSRTDRKVAGVAGGLGRHLDLDPTIIRVLLVVLVFFGGAGLVVYAAMWLLVPEEDTGRSVIGAKDSTRNVLLIGTLAVGALLAFSDSWNGFGVGWPLAVVAIVLFAVMLTRDRTRGGGVAAVPPEHAPPAYGPPGYGPAAYGPPPSDGGPPTAVWAPPPPPPAPLDPRRTGPLLFLPTLALLALVLGGLGLWDAAGGPVADAAYPAAALAVIGLALVLGAFVGRAGGLILLGLVSSVAIGGAAVANPSYSGERDLVLRPTSAVDLADGYSVPAGRIELDLRDLAEPSAVDGRRLDLHVNVGEIVVIVPRGMAVTVDATIDGAGMIELPNAVRDGWGTALSRDLPSRATTTTSTVELSLDLDFGHIQVRQP